MIRSVLGVLLIAGVLIGTTSSTATAQDDSDDSDTPGTGVVDLVEQTMWVAPDGDFVLRLDVSAAPRDAVLSVVVHDRLDGRNELADTYAGGALGRTLRTMVDASIAEVDPDGDGRVDLALGLRSGSGDRERLLITRGGLFPVAVDIEGSADSTEDDTDLGGFVTAFARTPDEVEHELGLAMIQTFDAAPSLRPDGSIEIASSARASLTAATETFSGDVPVTFRFVPETLAALATSGEELDAALLENLTSMTGAGEVAPAPWVDIDIDAFAESAMSNEIDDQLTLGDATLTELIDATPDRDTWVASPLLGTSGLVALDDRGVDAVVVPHESLVGPVHTPQAQPFDLNDGGLLRVPAITTDAALQAHAGSTGSSLLDAQHVLADLAAIWFDRPAAARGMALQLPEGAADRTFARAVLTGVGDSPLIEAGSIREVIEAADPAHIDGIDATVEEPSERLVLGLANRDVPNLAGYRTRLRRTAAQSATSADVFRESDDTITDALGMATSAADTLSTSERDSYLTAIDERVTHDLDNIAMPTQAAVTLPSRDGVIPITLVNNTGMPATVTIQLDSDKLEFPDGERVETTLTEVLNPIEIRVQVRSSGAFPLDMSLETPDGRIQLVESTYTIRSTAVSGLGIALSVAAVAILGAWWFRTARHARREHREREAIS